MRPDTIKESRQQSAAFEPRNAIREASISGLIGLGSGYFVASVSNALARKPQGALGVFRHRAPLYLTITSAPFVYTFTEAAMGNLRETTDWKNYATGGLIGGGVAGLASKRLASVLGLGAFAAVTLGTVAYTGGRLSGWRREPGEDVYDAREERRKKMVRPVEETMAHFNEGPGLKLPGYEDRRRQRIKERYGIEINPAKASVE